MLDWTQHNCSRPIQSAWYVKPKDDESVEGLEEKIKELENKIKNKEDCFRIYEDTIKEIMEINRQQFKQIQVLLGDRTEKVKENNNLKEENKILEKALRNACEDWYDAKYICYVDEDIERMVKHLIEEAKKEIK